MQVVSDYKTKHPPRWKNLPMLLAFVVLAILFGSIFYARGGYNNVYFCDMEKTVNSVNGHRFKAGWAYFLNGQTQNDEKSFSGKYSAKCDVVTKYGPTLRIENVNSGDIIEASVWQQSDDGYGTLVVQGEWLGFFSSTKKARKVHQGWEQLYLIDTIPLGVKNGKVKIYPMFSAQSGSVYFDDIKVNHIKTQNQVTWKTEQYEGEQLNLVVEQRDLAKLRIKRTEALNKGNLITGRKDLVKAKLKDKAQEVNVQIRLKGDLLDHLQGKKWSFRIIPDKGQAWNGMREFSVHNTASRAHLLEWIFHQMLRDEDILTTRYDFIQLALNDEPLGIYAYEEHFAYPLLYNQNRERGPILRISEDGLWQYAAAGFADKMPWYESAHIEAFERKDVLNNTELKQQFLEGQQKVYDYVQGNKTPGELFDLERMAKFMAIQDVCMAWHAFNSTNQRFYYNAVIGKLEPIGYDGYSHDGINWFKPPIMFGANVNSRVPKRFKFRNSDAPFHYFLFNDLTFTERYIHYLEKFTDEKYIHNFIEQHLPAIKSREQFIKREYREYAFDQPKLFKNATTIQSVLYPVENVTIKAYRGSGGKIVLENYHTLPIEIMGFGDKAIQYRLPQKLILESYNQEVPIRRYNVTISGKAKAVFCKTLGTDKIVRLPVFNWEIPVSQIAYLKPNINDLKKHPAIIIRDNIIYLKGGTQTLSEDLLIPENYEFQVAAGTTIHLSNNASIVSYSPVFFQGTKEHPVTIDASSGGQGLAVISASGKSEINNTIFTNLNARDKNGQITEGAVTFYKSNFECNRCYFEQIKSKDALNIIDAQYRLEDCLILNVNGDGIDANQSSGTIINLLVEQAGKDAVEISGGYVQARNIEVRKAFGAALNITRNGIAEVTDNFSIQFSEKGITASDLAKVTVHKIILEDVNQGFVVFQKLPEYGPAKVDIKDFDAKNINQLHVMDLGAELILKGKKIEVK